MPATAALITRLREAGIAAVVSGAGPSVLALTTSQGQDKAGSPGPGRPGPSARITAGKLNRLPLWP